MPRALDAVLGRAGWSLQRLPAPGRLGDTHPDLEPAFTELYARCAGYTMTSVERMYALWQAVRYVVAAPVPGDIVECGVWRGGSSMLAALTLLQAGDTDRGVHLFDTFAGMSEPTERDIDISGARMSDQWELHRDDAESPILARAGLADVRANMRRTGFPEQRLTFVRGRVEDTVPGRAPGRIAVLRLDTDWYESTRHELEHLWDRLAPGGVLIVDDYGHWAGAREAVDEFMGSLAGAPPLWRVDYTGRIAVKPPRTRDSR